jgi:hypothetical protein
MSLKPMAYVRMDDSLMSRTIEGGIPDTITNDTIRRDDMMMEELWTP